MIASVVREHHWAPDQIGALFIDSQDYQGLEFWYDDVMEMTAEIKKKPL